MPGQNRSFNLSTISKRWYVSKRQNTKVHFRNMRGKKPSYNLYSVSYVEADIRSEVCKLIIQFAGKKKSSKKALKVDLKLFSHLNGTSDCQRCDVMKVKP